MSQPITYTTISMDGTDKSHTVADKGYSVVFQAIGGDLTISMTAGGTGMTIKDGSAKVYNMSTMEGTVFFFVGAAPAVLEIEELTGLLS